MNKLDTFNKDKVKCKICKEYYDENEFKGWKLTICLVCLTKWRSRSDLQISFDDWCKNEQA
jgi:hypothetical protein